MLNGADSSKYHKQVIAHFSSVSCDWVSGLIYFLYCPFKILPCEHCLTGLTHLVTVCSWLLNRYRGRVEHQSGKKSKKKKPGAFEMFPPQSSLPDGLWQLTLNHSIPTFKMNSQFSKTHWVTSVSLSMILFSAIIWVWQSCQSWSCMCTGFMFLFLSVRICMCLCITSSWGKDFHLGSASDVSCCLLRLCSGSAEPH